MHIFVFCQTVKFDWLKILVKAFTVPPLFFSLSLSSLLFHIQIIKMVSNGFLKRFRKLDAYAKTLDDFRVRTATGGTGTNPYIYI
jgi:hypothetical protein